jgi:spermidine synthase
MTENTREDDAPYKVKVSIRFLITSLMASCLLAFCVGRAARIVVLGKVMAAQYPDAVSLQQCNAPPPPTLPPLVIKNGHIPKTRYTSKNFDTSMSASSSSWLAVSRDEESETFLLGSDEIHNSEEQQPMAEHLMVDIKHVDSVFLNSERMLANAIIEVMNEAKLTLLSYHCHGLVPMGVSCVGVLIQNYISFHTWPEEGVITLDLCVGGPKPLLHVLPIIEKAFGKPSSFGDHKPETRWAHRVRGFPTNDEQEPRDLGLYVLGDLATDVKKEVFSVETNFQRLDIYDVEDLNNKRPETSLLQRKARHAVVLRTDRVVMLNGWVESTLFHEAAYNEALVHPAMFSHPNPKKVAIIGGGEGSSLRETLKHKTVEEALLLELDETIVNVSKIHMPEWSDCSDLKGSADWCIEDPRTKVFHEDALSWFADRYSNDNSTEEPIDVVILNALGAESESVYAEAFYNNDTFVKSFYNSLSDNGILVMELGESPDSRDPDEMKSGDKNRVVALNLLESAGFESIHAFEESHCGFGAAWTFIVAFKSYSSRKLWYANSAEIELAIQKRTVRTKSGNSPLRYFDGATMMSYQVPSRTIETVFCRRDPAPYACNDNAFQFVPELPNLPASSMEVRISGQGEHSGRGVFTKVNVVNGTYISAETSAKSLRFYPSTYKIIIDLVEKCEKQAEELEVFEHYMHGYGFSSRRLGETEVFVDSSIVTFVNHGCNGTFNIGIATDFDEFTTDTRTPPAALMGQSHTGTSVFNPVIDRHLFYSGDVSLRDIDAGEEILDNYLNFIGSQEAWEDDVNDLRKQCSGEVTPDSVSEYENYSDEQSRQDL